MPVRTSLEVHPTRPGRRTRRHSRASTADFSASRLQREPAPEPEPPAPDPDAPPVPELAPVPVPVPDVPEVLPVVPVSDVVPDPVVPGPELLGPVPVVGEVVVGDALPRGVPSGFDTVLLLRVVHAAMVRNRARAETPAMTDFIGASLR